MLPHDPTYLTKKMPGMGLSDVAAQIDMQKMRQFRLGRVQEQLRHRGIAAAVLFDAVNMRYATGSRNAQISQLHTPYRCVLVPCEGKAILFDLAGWANNATELGTVDHVRDVATFAYFFAGPRYNEIAARWADDIADALGTVGAEGPVAIDRIEPVALHALEAKGVRVVNAQEAMEHARCIKSSEEIACMNYVITVAETAMARVRERLAPGLTENQLWATMHETNIAFGGEWIEYRLFVSGGNTNPWGNEASDRIIRAGDLVAFDTGMIGPFGYCADVSRTMFCGPGRPTAEQRRLYALAVEQIEYNIELVKPGASFREIAEKSWKIPDEFIANRYPQVVHGIGMGDEYPAVAHIQDWEARGFDGTIEENMTLCVESYIGAAGGAEGVKLEQQVLVTADGYQLLSTFPYEPLLYP